MPKCPEDTSALVPKCLGSEVSGYLELGSVLGLQLGFVIFRSKKSVDPHVRILPVAAQHIKASPTGAGSLPYEFNRHKYFNKRYLEQYQLV